MNILDRIIKSKLLEIADRKERSSLQKLEQSPFFKRNCLSLKDALTIAGSSGVIAEYKRKSPSKGNFLGALNLSDVCVAYQDAGAAALSVLTDNEYFGGSLEDLEIARSLVNIPILRKDFIIDSYQIFEAKAIGADVILLIAAALSPKNCEDFSKLARSLGLQVLLEVHNKEELEQYCNSNIDLLGVNNRDLKSFKTDINVSKQLAQLIPENLIKISESSLSNSRHISELREYGFKGFLIGENFLNNLNAGESCANFIKELRCA